jgi:hypothetical protein
MKSAAKKSTDANTTSRGRTKEDMHLEDLALRVRNRFDEYHHAHNHCMQQIAHGGELTRQDYNVLSTGLSDVANLIHELARNWDGESQPVRG